MVKSFLLNLCGNGKIMNYFNLVRYYNVTI